MRARLTQTGFDAVAAGLPDVLALGCDSAWPPPAGVSCGVDDPDSPRWLHMYLGSPESPFTFSVVGIDMSVRTGGPAALDREFEGSDWNPAADSEPELRPYCDDTGPAACAEILRRGFGDTGQGFCRPSNAPGCTGGNDYCCGSVATGLCAGNVELSSCATTRSSFALDLDSLRGNVGLHLFEDASGGAIEVILGCQADDVSDCTDPSEYVRLSSDISLFADFGTFGDATCFLHDDPSQGASLGVKQLRFVIRPELVTGEDGRPHFATDEGTVEVTTFEFDIFDMRLDPDYADPGCYDEAWGYFDVGVPSNQFQDCDGYCFSGLMPYLADIFSGTLSEKLANSMARTVLEKASGAAAEATGRLDLSALLDVVSPHAKRLDYLLAANAEGTAVLASPAAHGLNVDLDVGFTSAASPCVTPVLVPAFAAVTPPSIGDTVSAPDPVTGVLRPEPFDLALFLSEPAVQRATYGLYNSGGLCLDLLADSVVDLSNGAFAPTVGTISLLVPGLADLAPLDAPVDLTLVPHKPPVLTFGTGTVIEGVRESQLKLHWADVEISFYPFIDDAPLRALAFEVDLDVGLSLEASPTGGLLLLVDRVVVKNAIETYNEIGGTFDAQGVSDVISSFIPALVSGQPIDLELTTEALGVPFVPKVRAVTRDRTVGGYLGLFLSFCTKEELADPANALCYPRAVEEGRAVAAPRLAATQLDEQASELGLRVLVHSEVPAGRLEVAAAVDGVGPMFGFVPVEDGAAWLTHPRLRLPGAHSITIVGRDRARPGLWSQPQTFEVVVGAPDRVMEPARNEVAVEATDVGGEGCGATGASGLGAWGALLLLALRRRR